jgi:hypothetical protein
VITTLLHNDKNPTSKKSKWSPNPWQEFSFSTVKRLISSSHCVDILQGKIDSLNQSPLSYRMLERAISRQQNIKKKSTRNR